MKQPDLKKLAAVGNEIEHEKGITFDLFAALLLADGAGKWDIIMAASWITRGTRDEIRYVVGKLGAHLTTEERLGLSKIILVPSDDTIVTDILEASQQATDRSGVVYPALHGAYINDVLIERGYIILTNKYGNALTAAVSNLR